MTPTAFTDLISIVDARRVSATEDLDQRKRAAFGQFMTPPAVSALMASMYLHSQSHSKSEIRLLEPGAGVGSLTTAFVVSCCRLADRPRKISATLFEIDEALASTLSESLSDVRCVCEKAGVVFEFEVKNEDFIRASTQWNGPLFDNPLGEFDYVVMNPPYRKINTDSDTRAMLRVVGIETSNLYSAFMMLGARALAKGGEFVSITPRSFCNGPYFRPFRKEFLRTIALDRLHIFESREQAFKEDEVLQENIILHGIKNGDRQKVVISTSGKDSNIRSRTVPYTNVIAPDDTEAFIHVISDANDDLIREAMFQFKHSLTDLGLNVSTGRVVDFRATEFLRTEISKDTVPLIYASDFKDGYVEEPKPPYDRPFAIIDSPETRDSLLIETAVHVLVKRFSSKEEARRIVAAVLEPSRISTKRIGIENHLNYFHQQGSGLSKTFAIGLAAFLNSTIVDRFFRQFNGHTQVNATDLRSMRYPSIQELEWLAEKSEGKITDQQRIDELMVDLLKLKTSMLKSA